VVFGVAANVSISKLFMAGIFPGILIGAALWITWWWLGRVTFRRIGATAFSASWSHAVSAVMEPLRFRHIGATQG
jgi:TRAP-type C4-dicarboxylate transport system permease large subunit